MRPRRAAALVARGWGRIRCEGSTHPEEKDDVVPARPGGVLIYSGPMVGKDAGLQ